MEWNEFLENLAESFKLTDTEKAIFCYWLPSNDSYRKQSDICKNFGGMKEQTCKDHFSAIYAKFSDKNKQGYCQELGLKPFESREPKGKTVRIWLAEKYKQELAKNAEKSNSDQNIQNVLEKLYFLDCKEQKDNFADLMNILHPTGAFILQAADSRIRNLLINRFAIHFKEERENIRLFPIKISGFHPVNDDFEIIWKEFEFSQNINLKNSVEAIKLICELMETQSVMIVIHGFFSLKNIELLWNFWCQLVDSVHTKYLDSSTQTM